MLFFVLLCFVVVFLNLKQKLFFLTVLLVDRPRERLVSSESLSSLTPCVGVGLNSGPDSFERDEWPWRLSSRLLLHGQHPQ